MVLQICSSLIKHKKTKKYPVLEILFYSSVTWLHWSCRSIVAGFLAQSYVTTWNKALKNFCWEPSTHHLRTFFFDTCGLQFLVRDFSDITRWVYEVNDRILFSKPCAIIVVKVVVRIFPIQVITSWFKADTNSGGLFTHSEDLLKVSWKALLTSEESCGVRGSASLYLLSISPTVSAYL